MVPLPTCRGRPRNEAKCSPKVNCISCSSPSQQTLKIGPINVLPFAPPSPPLARFPLASRQSAELMSVSSQHISPTTTQPSHIRVSQEKQEAGASWKATEQHVLPYNRIWIVFTGFMLCTFLAALDQVFTPFITILSSLTNHGKRPSLPQHCLLSSNILAGAKITAGLAGIYVMPFLLSIPFTYPCQFVSSRR